MIPYRAKKQKAQFLRLRKLEYIPKKNLGQHFLTDKHMQQKIVQACDLNNEDIVVEIGPGQGALTRLMAPLVKRLICVETDRDLIEPLRQMSLETVHADFLKWDMGHLPDGVKIIGNIPYYISTPIIEKLIKDRKKISTAFLTVQLEFGQRLTAKAGDGKVYGSLSCFAQYYSDIKMLFKIKNTCFRPAPKVDSCFLRIEPRPYGGEPAEEQFLFKLIQTAFQQRRKTIVNALKGLRGQKELENSLRTLDISPNARPEELSLSNYIGLCKLLMIK